MFTRYRKSSPSKSARLILAGFLVFLLTADAVAQAGKMTEQQQALIAKQAAELDAAPRLSVGDNAFDSEALSAGFIAWIEVADDGLYEIAIPGPGALVLASFPTPDGRYDGVTSQQQHGKAASLDQPVTIGPVLLSSAHPYMVSASSKTATTVTLRQVLKAGPAVTPPAEANTLAGGEHLYQADQRFDLRIEPATTSLRIEVIGEARASTKARLGSKTIPVGGLYPWKADAPTELRIDVDRAEETPVPLVLVRIAEFEQTLDETEPNDDTANPFSPGTPWSGLLLPLGDKDVLVFRIPADGHFALAMETGLDWPRFEATLRQPESRGTTLWNRLPQTGAFTNEPLYLEAGDYELKLERKDSKPLPVPYTVRLDAGSDPGPNREAEPNDSPAVAMRLSDSLTVRGSGAKDDADFYTFSVANDKTGHLWRLFGNDISRIELSGQGGRIVRVDATDKQVRADSLALEPGDYVVQVSAEGDYLLRVMDLGERPQGFEAEPNNSTKDGQRLEFGEVAQGGFHTERDEDYYLFRLEAASAIEINVVPSGDGTTDTTLYFGGKQWGQRIAFEPGDPPMTYRSRLPAGDWALRMRANNNTIQEAYKVSIRRLAALAGSEPDHDPLQAAKLPRNGDVSDSVGGFDGADQVFIPLPRGEGTAAMFCNRPDDVHVGRWRIFNWSTGDSLGDVRDGVLVFDYSPALGGAVRFELQGGTDSVDYRCRLRFLPQPATATRTAVSEPTKFTRLSTGEHTAVTLTPEAETLQIPLAIGAGDVGALGCQGPDNEPLAVNSRLWSTEDTDSISRQPLGSYRLLRAGQQPTLELDGGRAETLPLQIRCTLLAVDDLPRPTDLGPAAEFQPEMMIASSSMSEADEPGLPPPGLEALILRSVPDEQPTGNLPVAIDFDKLPQLAGYVDAGQTFTVKATLTNNSDIQQTLSLAAEIPAEGWQMQPLSEVTLAAGASSAVSIMITAPPWISPVLQPTLTIRADSGDAFAAALAEIPIDPNATPVGPVTYWYAPDALRGGLNVLHHGLGARLIEINGAPTDEKRQNSERWVHDGLAPHIDSNGIQKDVVFQLAAPAELAGAMVQLRSTDSPERWPSGVEFFVPSADNPGWQRVAAGKLTTTHAPQYFVFEQPVATDRLRVVLQDCRGRSCPQAAVQDIQAFSVPGQHPVGLPPINAADLDLGGHVVFADPDYEGSWNNSFLKADATASHKGLSTRINQHAFVVGFHQNRAAHLQSVVWVADPDDGERIPAAQIEASTESPAGPWTAVGSLPAPPEGDLRSQLVFDKPVWARYLRVTLPIEPDQGHFGPDGFEAIEAAGTSVLGLWEDDQPRAAYEAAHDIAPSVAVAPTGGPDRDSAVALALDQPIASSVLIEHNEDWWRLTVPDGTTQELTLDFGARPPAVATELFNAEVEPVGLEVQSGGRQLQARLAPGQYFLRVLEPPRSVVIAWDTSGSVAAYRERTLAAVRTWARSLQPGRDALQLLPFGPKGFILEDWAEQPEAVESALRALPEEDSSASETAMMRASRALAKRQGGRGIVIITDAQTSMEKDLWPALLEAMPRVVSLSIDSDGRQNAAIMMDWAALNGGRFRRVIGALGLADGMDMANALFRAPKAYKVTATLEELVEPKGEASLTIAAPEQDATPAGAVELILDASGSMLQQMDGRRRIDIAHDALQGLVQETLPDGLPFAFRAFGLEKDACLTELVVPLGPLNRDQAAKKIGAVPAINLAKTAIADSLRAARNDLADTAPPRVVVLVTDGEETCEGDPVAAIAELREAGFDARVNIVGFAIDDEELAATFADWAKAGGGSYFDAGSAGALETSIAEALKPRFEITRTYLDGRTEVVATAAVGETVVVPAGRLTIAPGSAAIGEPVTLDVVPNASIDLGYNPDQGLQVKTEE